MKGLAGKRYPANSVLALVCILAVFVAIVPPLFVLVVTWTTLSPIWFFAVYLGVMVAFSLCWMMCAGREDPSNKSHTHSGPTP